MNAHSKQAKPLRQSESSFYDPTQRAVGAVVLISLMMILYLILKAILGISDTGVKHALTTPLQEELVQQNTDSSALPMGTETKTTKELFSNEFVFLNLQGRPMGEGNSVVKTAYSSANLNNLDEEYWYVQTASFKDPQAAEKMVKRLQTNKFDAYVAKSGEWYAVRLQSQTDKNQARQQLRDLKKKMRISGILRHIKPD